MGQEKQVKDSSLHVFQVLTRFPYHGGIQRHVFEISKCLKDRGVQVTIVASNHNNRELAHEIIDGLEVVRFMSWSPGESFHFAPSMIVYLQSIGDSNTVVHAHNYQAMPALAAALSTLWNRRPLVFTPHFHPRGGTKLRSLLKILYRPMGKLIFNSSKRVIALTQHERLMLESEFGIPSDKVLVIPSGPIRRSVKIHPRSRNILYVGRLERYKGIDNILEILPKVLARVPDATLTIVGSGPDEQRLRKIVETTDLSEHVNFAGNIASAELDALLSKAGLLALLSQYEAYSLIVGEALERGVPVVATAVGGIPEAYGNETGCTLVPYPPPVEKVAEIIDAILSGKLHDQNRETAGEQMSLSWAEIGERLIEVYESLM